MSNKHHKQFCPSQKQCQVCSGFHHTTLHDPAKQINRPTAAFSTEVFSGSNPTASSSRKASSQTPNTSTQQKIQTNKTPNSHYGQTFNNQCQQNVQRRNLMFLQTSNEPGLQIQHELYVHQRNPRKKVYKSPDSKNNLENQRNAPNHFPYFDKDTSQELTSPTKSGKLAVVFNLVSRDVHGIETAQINLSDNVNMSQNLSPPLQILNRSGNYSLSNPFNFAEPTRQLHADGLFAQNSALEQTLKLNLQKQRNNQDSTTNRHPQYHNFPNLQQIFGTSQVQLRTSGCLDSQLLNCDLQKLPCLPTVAKRT